MVNEEPGERRYTVKEMKEFRHCYLKADDAFRVSDHFPRDDAHRPVRDIEAELRSVRIAMGSIDYYVRQVPKDVRVEVFEVECLHLENYMPYLHERACKLRHALHQRISYLEKVQEKSPHAIKRQKETIEKLKSRKTRKWTVARAADKLYHLEKELKEASEELRQ